MKKLVFVIMILAALRIYAEGVEIVVIGNELTKEATIRRFFPDDLSEDNLEKVVENVKQEMMKTEWFERVEIFTLGKENKRIVVEVSEAFNKRFGGGPIFFSYGELNHNGKGDSFFVDAGINKQKLNYSKYFLTDNFAYGLDFGNQPETYYANINASESEQIQRLNFRNKLEYRATLNINLGLELEYFEIRDTDYKKIDDDFKIGASIKYDNIISKKYHNISYSNFYKEELNRVEIESKSHLPIGNFIEISGRNRFSIQDDKDKPEYYYMDLVKNDGIRNKNLDNLIGNSMYLSTLELRLNIGEANLPLIPQNVKTAFFIDYGKAFLDNGDFSLENGNLVYGGELRIILDAPVYLPIRFIYGISDGVDNQFGVSLIEVF